MPCLPLYDFKGDDNAAAAVVPKRRRRVHRASGRPSSVLPAEIMALACLQLHSSPRHVFLMLKACKGLRRHLTSEWWERFWKAHAPLIRWKLHHLMLNEFSMQNLRPAQYSHVLRLVYGLRCECCGHRWHHTIVPLVQKRVCMMCMRERFISNRVLYYRYGLEVWRDLIEPYGHLIAYVPMTEYRYANQVLRMYTADPIDLEAFHGGACPRQNLTFLWRDDVEALFDLEACALAQKERLRAVNVLKAALRARTVRSLMPSSRHRLENVLETLSLAHIQPGSQWLVGGPLRLHHLWTRARHGSKDVCGRPRTARGVSMAAWEKLSAYNPRMLLGFNEVSIKSWLEAFKGRVPPPDGQHPEYDRGYWRFSKVVYDLRTRHRLALPARTAVRP